MDFGRLPRSLSDMLLVIILQQFSYPYLYLLKQVWYSHELKFMRKIKRQIKQIQIMHCTINFKSIQLMDYRFSRINTALNSSLTPEFWLLHKI